MINRKSLPLTAPVRQEAVRSPRVSGRSDRRRLVMLILALLIALGAFWAVVGLPRWRAYRYAHAGFRELGTLCSQRGEIQACTALCNRSLAAKHPEWAVAPLQSAWDKVKTDRLTIAMKDRGELEGDLALALMLSLHSDEAKPLFQDVFVLDPQSSQGHLALALWLQQTHRDDPASQELKIVTGLDPKNDLAWYLMSHLYNIHNMLDKGRAAAQKAIAINPNVSSYWQELGDSYGYAARHDDSLKAYEQELKLDPNLPVAQADVARALALTAKTPDQYENAVQHLQASIKTNSVNLAPGYTLLGELHLRFGHYQEAADALKLSIHYDNTIPEVFYNLARALQLEGDKAESAKYMNQYEDMNNHFLQTQRLIKKMGELPNDPKVHLQLARAWEYYKDWPQVWQECQDTLRLQPGQPEALHMMQQIQALAAAGKAEVPYNFVLQGLLKNRNPLTDDTTTQKSPSAYESFGK